MIPELTPLEGKYRILRKLREGGMGAIYLVRHRLLGELRVVKVLRAQLQGEEEFRDRFAREARVAIQLRHPHVAQLYDFAVDERGSGYMVLEYVAGRTLQELVAAHRIDSIPLALEVAGQALDAIGFLHRRGFVHRDISPDNLMLSRTADGEPLVKLIDLGIVKILRGEEGKTGTQVFLGKVRYASPEQFESSRIDGRSDLYSFGVLLYELLTGTHPFPGEGMHSMVSGHVLRPPRPFEQTDPAGRVPEALRRVVLDALAKNPDDRPQTAEEFAERLRATAVETADLRALVAGLGLDATDGSAPTLVESEDLADSAQQALDDQFGRERRTPEPESLATTTPGAGSQPATDARDLLVERKLAEWRELLDEPADERRRLPGWRAWIAAAVAVTLVGVGITYRIWSGERPVPAAPAPASGPEAAAPPGRAPRAAGAPAAEPEPPPPREASAAPADARAPGPAPSGAETVVAPPPPGWLRIDAAPWGVVTAVVAADGGAVALPESAATPLLLELPAGSYRIRVRDPRTGRLRETSAAVAPEATGAAFLALAPVDARDYFRRLGLAP